MKWEGGKDSMNGISDRVNLSEEKISKQESIAVETSQNETKKKAGILNHRK